jgi:hypothetical protein
MAVTTATRPTIVGDACTMGDWLAGFLWMAVG